MENEPMTNQRKKDHKKLIQERESVEAAKKKEAVEAVEAVEADEAEKTPKSEEARDDVKEVEGTVVEGALCKDAFAAAGKEIGEALTESLGKVIAAAASGAKFAGQKLGGLAGSAKLRGRNVLLNKKVVRLCAELGEVVSDLHAEGEDDFAGDKEVKAILRKIEACRAELGENNESIAASMKPSDGGGK